MQNSNTFQILSVITSNSLDIHVHRYKNNFYYVALDFVTVECRLFILFYTNYIIPFQAVQIVWLKNQQGRFQLRDMISYNMYHI